MPAARMAAAEPTQTHGKHLQHVPCTASERREAGRGSNVKEVLQPKFHKSNPRRSVSFFTPQMKNVPSLWVKESNHLSLPEEKE